MISGLQAGDPRQVGPYQLLGRLGCGGMGSVFLGRPAAGDLVAVKVIRADLAGDPGFRARFDQEVAAVYAVSGPFTAAVAGADTSGPEPWLATSYVPGPPLAELVRRHGPLPLHSVLVLGAGLATALGVIHAAGLVHRDLKPSNVLVAGDGPRVIDFGISRAAGASALTQAGMVMGSPGFMAPEQAEGASVGPASDVFGLGTLLAFAAAGEGPFGAGSMPALLYRVVYGQPSTEHLPRPLRALVERCLAKDPAARPSVAGLLAELGAVARPGRAGDWLPAPVAETVRRYAAPGPVPVTASHGWLPVTGSQLPPPSGEPAALGRRPARPSRLARALGSQSAVPEAPPAGAGRRLAVAGRQAAGGRPTLIEVGPARRAWPWPSC